MCTCTCTPPLSFVKRQANRSLNTNRSSARSVQTFPRYGKGGTSAGALVQMYATHDLCNMHRDLASKHKPNLVTIGISIPELKLSSQFLHPLTLHVPQWLPRWMGVGSIHGRRDVATHQRRPFVNRTRGCRDISSSKASRSRVGPCRAVSGRSYLDFFTKPRKNPHRSLRSLAR